MLNEEHVSRSGQGGIPSVQMSQLRTGGSAPSDSKLVKEKAAALAEEKRKQRKKKRARRETRDEGRYTENTAQAM